VSIKLFLLSNPVSFYDSIQLKILLAKLVAVQKVDFLEVYEFYESRRIWHHKRAEEARDLIVCWKRSENLPIKLLEPEVVIEWNR
jgi:hypothetical protein